MKKLCVATLMNFAMAAAAFAEVTVYHIIVDGLECESCASEVDRQLREIEGVDSVDIILELKGVNVRMAEGYELTDAQVQKILDDAGVTLDHIEHHAIGQH